MSILAKITRKIPFLYQTLKKSTSAVPPVVVLGPKWIFLSGDRSYELVSSNRSYEFSSGSRVFHFTARS